MVAFEAWFAGEVECFTHGGEVCFELAIGIRADKETEADTEQDVFHEGSCEGGRVNCGEVD